jgi:NTE family protein
MRLMRRVLILVCAGMLARPLAAQTVPTEGVPQAQARPRVALVLSGGGARGFAHVGVLRVLDELKLPVDIITGTSMGSIVGGSYAAGYTVQQLEQLVGATDWTNLFNVRPQRAELGWRRKADDYKNLTDIEFGISSRGLGLPRGLAGAQRLDLYLRALGGPVKEVPDLGALPIPFAAMAADLVTGAPVVLQQNVSLSTALRASMAVPGAFAPVEFGQQLLVDGGIVNNLPVEQARRMGAQVIIAVDVGTPLLPRERLNNVLSVAEQLMLIIGRDTVDRAIASLAPADVLIVPELAAYSSSSFDKAADIVAAGEAAARKLAPRLRALAVAPAVFDAREEQRTRLVRADRPVTLATVEVVGLRTVDPEAVRRDLDLPLGEPVSTAKIEQNLLRVYGNGDFETISYQIDGPDGARRLMVTPVEKSWGYNVLRFGGNIQTDFRDENRFNLLVAHSWRWLNAWGAEWRNELQIGDQRRVLTEWYQPLGAGSRWFVLPQLASVRNSFSLDLEGQRIASFENVDRSANLALGYAFDRLGTVRLNAARSRISTEQLVGLPLTEGSATLVNSLAAELRFDTLDRVSLPRSGSVLDLRYTRYAQSAGTAGRRDALKAGAEHALSLGRYTLYGSARVEASPQEGAVLLGRLFELSGTRPGAFIGSRSWLARTLLYRNISDAFGDLAMPVNAGLSLEVGQVLSRSVLGADSGARRAGSLFLGIESPVGPIYFALGRTFGGSSAAYLVWGVPQ